MRHLLAHASGLAFDANRVSRPRSASGSTRAPASRCSPTSSPPRPSIDFADYVAEAVFAPLGMSASALVGPAGHGAQASAARPRPVRSRTAPPDPHFASDVRGGHLRAVSRAGRNPARIRLTAAQRLGSGIRNSFGQEPALDGHRRTRRGRSAISASPGPSCGSIPAVGLACVALDRPGFRRLGQAAVDRAERRYPLGTAEDDDTPIFSFHWRNTGITRHTGQPSALHTLDRGRWGRRPSSKQEARVRALNQFADVTTGVIYIHSSPAASVPAYRMGVDRHAGQPRQPEWTSQPADDGFCGRPPTGSGPVGTASAWSTRYGPGRCCASRSPRTPARASTANGTAMCPAWVCGADPPVRTAMSSSGRCGCGP